ncbi:MAG: SusD/RagB family nutrient-binding outer membrane lipoprotein [Aequorivita sp.]
MKKLILIFTAAVFAVSCSDHLEDLNKNIKDPTEVSGELLFASAQKQLADQIVTPNVNSNNNRLWVQHWQETTYPDESRYDQATRAIPDNHWREMYRDVLRDLKEATTNIEGVDNDITNELKANKLAIIEVLNVYAYSNLVETYGNIPYTEALDIDNLLPKFDDAETVYKDLLVRLTAAINSMDTSKGSFGSAEDLIYAGDVASWKMFANTLKLRMGITLADADGGTAQTAIESAYTGVFGSNADNAGYMYSVPPNMNPVNNNLVLSNRNDYVAGETIIDKMNDLDDPRIGKYFTEVDGEYVGGPIGEQTVYANYSHVADIIKESDYPGYLMTYVEAKFLLAEAAARGYSVGADAETHYNEAITASFEFWGADGIDDYLAQPEVAYDAANWKQSIGTQAWLGYFNRTFAAWLSVRRLDYPILVEPYNASSGFPVRYTYPVSEINLNGSNYNEAASAIGGDETETRLFWDKFDNTFGF